MGERTSNEMENLSIQTNNRFPRDLLRRFTVGTADAGPPRRSDPEEDLGSGSGDEVELNLGLSLGGRFGVDKSNSKLVRSSSIAAILPVVRDDDVLATGHGNTGPGPGMGRSYSALIRTSSLPVETEEEWRKRKELQSLRRLAAKRRRSEKQKTLTRGERDEYVAAMSRVGSSPGPPFRSDKWASGSSTDAYSGGATTAAGETARGGGGAPSSQVSQESQGSMSEYQSTHRQGSSGSGGETSSLQERNNHDVIGSSSSNLPPVGGERESGPARNQGASSMEEMPCVFTQGDGPNGRVIEGILYKYGRGEQVKILCACHGSFLSPAEFVKHAGGSDVLHPLKHIVVKPSSSFT